MGKVRYKEDHANKGKVSREVIWQEYTVACLLPYSA